MADSLTPEQRRSLDDFQAITATSDSQVALDHLRQNDFNLEAAIGAKYDGTEPDESEHDYASEPLLSSRPSTGFSRVSHSYYKAQHN